MCVYVYICIKDNKRFQFDRSFSFIYQSRIWKYYDRKQGLLSIDINDF